MSLLESKTHLDHIQASKCLIVHLETLHILC
jgi:hypothetical protein